MTRAGILARGGRRRQNWKWHQLSSTREGATGLANSNGGRYMAQLIIPTLRGDVIILRTDRSFTIHAVGLVSKNGQQDHHAQTSLKYATDRDAAEADAKAMVAPGRRIFFRNIDTNEWSEIPCFRRTS